MQKKFCLKKVFNPSIISPNIFLECSFLFVFEYHFVECMCDWFVPIVFGGVIDDCACGKRSDENVYSCCLVFITRVFVVVLDSEHCVYDRREIRISKRTLDAIAVFVVCDFGLAY